jgi:hypothetical protein
MMAQLIYKVLLLAWRGAYQFGDRTSVGSVDQGRELGADVVELFSERLQEASSG